MLERRRISREPGHLDPDGTSVSVVGVGGMRFPRVSQEAVTAVISRAVGYGMDYVETSPGYGDSEVKIGVALAETRLRRRVLLSTKSSKRDEECEVYGTRDFARRRYRRLKPPMDACTECGECLPKCPQKLDIPTLLATAHETLGDSA